MRVNVDWSKAIKQRDQSQQSTASSPLYLLAPEMTVLVSDRKYIARQLLFSTLWMTGGKISETLQLRRKHFRFERGCLVIRFAPGGSALSRTVPVVDVVYRKNLAKWFDREAFSNNEIIWSITRQTAARWLDDRVEVLWEDGERFTDYPITLSTFRHSYAMNWLLHSAPIHLLRVKLGHRRRESTERYLRYISFDDCALVSRMQFRC